MITSIRLTKPVSGLGLLEFLPWPLPWLRPNFTNDKELSMYSTKQLFLSAALTGALAASPLSARAGNDKPSPAEKQGAKGSAGSDEKHQCQGKDKAKEKKEGSEKAGCSGKGGCGGKAGCGGKTK